MVQCFFLDVYYFLNHFYQVVASRELVLLDVVKHFNTLFHPVLYCNKTMITLNKNSFIQSHLCLKADTSAFKFWRTGYTFIANRSFRNGVFLIPVYPFSVVIMFSMSVMNCIVFSVISCILFLSLSICFISVFLSTFLVLR